MKLIVALSLLMYGYYSYLTHLSHTAMSLEKQVMTPYGAVAANPEPNLQTNATFTVANYPPLTR